MPKDLERNDKLKKEEFLDYEVIDDGLIKLFDSNGDYIDQGGHPVQGKGLLLCWEHISRHGVFPDPGQVSYSVMKALVRQVRRVYEMKGRGKLTDIKLIKK